MNARSRHLTALTVAALVLSAVAPVAAKEPASIGASEVIRHVLIVANNRSQRDGLEPLRFADDDGLLYQRLLSLFSDRVVLLTSLDDDTQARYLDEARRSMPPTRAAVRAALEHAFTEIAAAKGRGARVDFVFVFVGHGGVDDEGKGYVHLEDGVFTRAELFAEVIAASPADFTHLIIDACHAYSMVGGRGDDDDPGPTPFEMFLTGDDLESYPGAGVLVATSDERETHEWSRIRAGVFSHQVRSALAGAADVSHDGRIEYSEVAAFVGSANAGLAGVGKRITTFAWPPARDRRVDLVDLRAAPEARYVVIEPGPSGRFFLEGSEGARWAELHKPSDEGVVVSVPAEATFYLRDGAHEITIEPGSEVVRVAAPLTEPYAAAERGAVDQAFDAGLFAMPFGVPYYQGFVSARPQLIPSPVSEEPFLIRYDGGVVFGAIYAASRWVVTGGYQLSEALMMSRRRQEHGLFVRLQRRWAARWDLGFMADFGYADLKPNRGVGLVRLGLFAGAAYRQPLIDVLALSGGLDAGLSILALNNDGGVDGSVPAARLTLQVEGIVADPWAVVVGATVSGYVMTLDGDEKPIARPGFFVGVRW